jgi:predicted nucleic acid-binding protein
MLIVDAGPLFAAACESDQDFARCTDLLSRASPPFQVPTLVAAEAAYFIGKRLGPKAEADFGKAFVDGELFAEPVDPADWDRIVELMERYIDLPLGMADASLIALAERMGATEIATLDHRHIGVVRPSHVTHFTLLP